jgi:hypothetical protein
MRGDATRRFCDHCQLHVHNLSAMSRRQRDRFVRESGGRGCIAYQLRADGTMITPSFWSKVLQPFRRLQFAAVAVLAAVLPFLFTACASRRTLGAIAPPAHACSTVGEAETTVTLGTPVPPAAGHRQRQP